MTRRCPFRIIRDFMLTDESRIKQDEATRIQENYAWCYEKDCMAYSFHGEPHCIKLKAMLNDATS